MAASWHLAPSLAQLRREINTRWPNRDKSTDGTIGDTAHSSRASDHNPNSRGSVNAIDVDKDGIDPTGLVGLAIKDPRVNYVIYNRQIWQRRHGFKPRPYSGINAHRQHVHVSILQSVAAEQSTTPWGVARIGASSGVKPSTGGSTTKPSTTNPNQSEEDELMALSKDTLKQITDATLGVNVTANGKSAPLVQHMAEAFVADKAQSAKLAELDGKISALSKQLAAMDQKIAALAQQVAKIAKKVGA